MNEGMKADDGMTETGNLSSTVRQMRRQFCFYSYLGAPKRLSRWSRPYLATFSFFATQVV
jgi:hypothetical protein